MTINKFILHIAVFGSSILCGITHTHDKPINPNKFIGDTNGNGSHEFIDIGLTSVDLYEISKKELRLIWNFNLPNNSGETISKFLWDDIDRDGLIDLVVVGRRLNNISLYVFSNFIYQNKPTSTAKYKHKIGTQITDIALVEWEPNLFYLAALIIGRDQSIEILDVSDSQHITMVESISLLNIKSHRKINFITGRFSDKTIGEQILISQGKTSIVIGKNFYDQKDGDDFIIRLFGNETDLNKDNLTDFFGLMNNGNIASNIWDKPVMLYGEPVHYMWQSGNEIIVLRKNGDIQKYYINALSSSLTKVLEIDNFVAKDFLESDIFVGNENYLLLSRLKDEKNYIIYLPIEHNINFGGQLINLENPDHTLYVNNEFNLSLESDTGSVLIGFEPDSLPTTMTYITDANQLIWEPTLDELGYHNILYQLKYRTIGEFLSDSSTSMVSYIRDEEIYKKEYSHLVYVNEPPYFDIKEFSYTVVNLDTLKDDILFLDRNVDALFNVGIIQSEAKASFSYNYNHEKLDSLAIDRALIADADSIDYDTDDYAEIKQRYGQLFWVPNTNPGDYDISLWCTDGFDSDTISVSVTVHPNIDLSDNKTGFIAKIGEKFKYQVQFNQSPMSAKHSFSLINAPANMIIDSTGLISWIPMISDIDTQKFSVSVTDGIDTKLIDMEIFVNERPKISTTPDSTVYLFVNENFEFDFLGFDPNKNQNMSWRIESANSEIVLENQKLRWNANKLGHSSYILTVHDDIDTSKYVGYFYVNDPPKILNSATTIINAGDPFFHQIDTNDQNEKSPTNPDSINIITFFLDESPKGMKLMDNGDMLWRPSADDLGYHDVKYTVSDGLDSISQSFTLFVNALPTAVIEKGLDVAVGDTLVYKIPGIDGNEGDTISYTFNNQMQFGSLDQKTGVMEYSPKQKHLGNQNIKVNLSDQHNNGNTEITIPVFVYKLPVLLNDPEPHAFASIKYNYIISSIDMDGSSIGAGNGSIKINSQPPLSIYDESSQQLSWIPKKTDVGNHRFSFELTDSLGYSKSFTYDIEVYDNPCPPCETNTSMNKFSKNIAPSEATNSNTQSKGIEENSLNSNSAISPDQTDMLNPDKDESESIPQKEIELQEETLPDKDIDIAPTETELEIEPKEKTSNQ